MSLKSLIKETIIVDSLFDIEQEMMSIKESILEQLIIEGVDDPGILKCVFMIGGLKWEIIHCHGNLRYR